MLVRPAFSNVYEVYGKLPKDHELRPPLGLLYLASSLELYGHDVIIIDAEALCLSPDNLYAKIIEYNPDFVGFTSTTPEFHHVAYVCKMIKESFSYIKIIVGGPHVSALPNETIKENPFIDYIVCGEGEKAIVEIVENLPANQVIRCRDTENLDELPKPARHLVDYENYKYAMPCKGLVKMDVIESSRGCPFLCTFCYNSNRVVRYRDAALVVDEIEESYKKEKIKCIMFFDDTLTVSKKHIIALCDEIIKRRLNKKIQFYGNTRANTTDEEILIKMKMAGFAEISLGVESGNPVILKEIKKGATLEQYVKSYKLLYRFGFQTRASFIVGFPYETHESVSDTIKFAKKLDVMRATCNILTPYPGSEVYRQALEGKGIYLLCKDWREFKRWGTSVVKTDCLDKNDLEFYQKKFLIKFYTQPKVILYHIRQILKGNLSYFYYRPLVFAVISAAKYYMGYLKAPVCTEAET